MRRPVEHFIRISSNHGDASRGSHFGKHLGTDYSVPVNTSVKACAAGAVIAVTSSYSVGKQVHIREAGNGRVWRYLHLNRQDVRVGQQVGEGQQIALSGGAKGSDTTSTGPHVHVDVRKADTTWNAGYANYYNPEALIAGSNSMPAIGSRVQLVAPDRRTTFRAGTTTQAGVINVTDASFVYVVRGFDPKYPGRILINSKSAGGDGVALALKYTNGQVIPGWKQL